MAYLQTLPLTLCIRLLQQVRRSVAVRSPLLMKRGNRPDGAVVHRLWKTQNGSCLRQTWVAFVFTSPVKSTVSSHAEVRVRTTSLAKCGTDSVSQHLRVKGRWHGAWAGHVHVSKWRQDIACRPELWQKLQQPPDCADKSVLLSISRWARCAPFEAGKFVAQHN